MLVSSVWDVLYRKFFLICAHKKWWMARSEFKPGVAADIPVRVNIGGRYLIPRFQALPLYGYTRVFEHMLDHVSITFKLDGNFTDVWSRGSRGMRFIRIRWMSILITFLGS
ncbi:MAG: hypothetical protein CME40_05580 [Haliea sp.]|nr:hypothetical protein [Haliea sp.]